LHNDDDHNYDHDDQYNHDFYDDAGANHYHHHSRPLHIDDYGRPGMQ
jgi:hypothetical protein